MRLIESDCYKKASVMVRRAGFEPANPYRKGWLIGAFSSQRTYFTLVFDFGYDK